MIRVDVGTNASGSTTSGSSASNASSTPGSVIADTAVLAVDNPNLELRPGMTATASIVTSERQNALLVPNAAFRWSPERDAANGKAGGVTSVLVPRMGRRGGGGGGREVSIGRGSRQTVYVLGADGTPQAVQIVVGESNGSETEVTGGDLREGQEVITARLAAGQVQDKSQRQRRREGRDGGGNQAQGNEAAPAPAAPAPAQPAAQPAPPPPGQPRPQAPATQAPPAAGGAPDVRAMTPEQRRAYFQSLSPEQRAQMRARRQQGAGGGAPPDGQ